MQKHCAATSYLCTRKTKNSCLNSSLQGIFPDDLYQEITEL